MLTVLLAVALCTPAAALFEKPASPVEFIFTQKNALLSWECWSSELVANNSIFYISNNTIGKKVNVNLGISKDAHDYDFEMAKANKAIEMGAHGIMDLSNYGKTADFRIDLIQQSSAMIGTVPIYDALGFYDKELAEIDVEEFFFLGVMHGLGMLCFSYTSSP